jgi:hypothetical protein
MVGHRLLSTPARLSILSLWVAKPAQALDLDRHRRLLVGAYGANNLIKRVKRVAFGFRSFRNFRVRVLLYAGRPDWSKLAGLTPR